MREKKQYILHKEKAREARKVWEAWAKAREAWAKAQEARENAREKAREARKVWEAWAKAREKAQSSPEMLAWHKKVCIPECKWDGKTLFPVKK